MERFSGISHFKRTIFLFCTLYLYKLKVESHDATQGARFRWTKKTSDCCIGSFVAHALGVRTEILQYMRPRFIHFAFRPWLASCYYRRGGLYPSVWKTSLSVCLYEGLNAGTLTVVSCEEEKELSVGFHSVQLSR